MIDPGRTHHLWRDNVDGSETYVRGRGGVKGSGTCHVDKWRTYGRGEDGIGGDTIGGGPHDNTIPFRTPPAPPLLKAKWQRGSRIA
jgi:hypothetical protein